MRHRVPSRFNWTLPTVNKQRHNCSSHWKTRLTRKKVFVVFHRIKISVGVSKRLKINPALNLSNSRLKKLKLPDAYCFERTKWNSFQLLRGCCLGKCWKVYKNLWARIRHKRKQKKKTSENGTTAKLSWKLISPSKSRQQALCAQLLVFLPSHSDSYIIDSKIGLTLNIPRVVLWGPQSVIFCDPAVTISTNLVLIFVWVPHQLKINIM